MSKRMKLMVAGLIAALTLGGMAPVLAAEDEGREDEQQEEQNFDWLINVGNVGRVFTRDGNRVQDGAMRGVNLIIHRQVRRLVEHQAENLRDSGETVQDIFGP